MIFYSGIFEVHGEAKHAPDTKKVDPAEQTQKALQLQISSEFVVFYLTGCYRCITVGFPSCLVLFFLVFFTMNSTDRWYFQGRLYSS